jgi:hypothetical protein
MQKFSINTKMHGKTAKPPTRVDAEVALSRQGFVRIISNNQEHEHLHAPEGK